MFDLCTISSAQAQLLKVISVIRRNSDRTWHGDMLDGLVFVKAQVDHGAKPDGAPRRSFSARAAQAVPSPSLSSRQESVSS